MLKVKIENREVEFETPDVLLENSSPEDIKKLISLMPKMTQSHFVNWISDMNKKKALLIWKKELEEKKKELEFNKEDIESIVKIWNSIIDEYLDYKYLRKIGVRISGTKIHNFNISDLYSKLKDKDNEKNELAYRLIDVKLYLCFNWSIMFVQYTDAFKIVGNNDLLGVTPEAVNWINGLVYRISLLSIFIEKTLDFMEFVIKGKVKDHKRGKWEKRLELISTFIDISEEEQKVILDFKSSYRTAELHKMSAVRAMTSRDRWISVKKEEDLVSALLERLYEKIVN
ncbi:hypothetical protein SAMN05444411_1197 [Lutibacter oricola]|uniref:Uncharacterized protein n=1 Tax=Lutibacter oricola TaxID=762486 RepID=A0A1H3GVK9_9FLAO|nr:hypothetical protein [Lutibacter oricola]SDY07281.1 hypothetical protein SAMN05444411_1197 [Lutibacter oricola]